MLPNLTAFRICTTQLTLFRKNTSGKPEGSPKGAVSVEAMPGMKAWDDHRCHLTTPTLSLSIFDMRLVRDGEIQGRIDQIASECRTVGT